MVGEADIISFLKPISVSVFGQKYVKTSTSGVILSFESVFGCILSILILGECPGVRFVIGAMLMMCSFLIVEKISLPLPKRVAVKCVDIRRNTSGEGGLLDCN